MTVAIALIRKDGLEFRRDRRALVAAILVVLLAVAAVATAYVHVSGYERDRTAAETRDRQTWLSQGARNPHGAAHFSSWAMRPLTTLAIVEPGIAPYAGSGIWMEAHKQNPARNRPQQDTAAAFDVGQFSLAWLLQFVVPLLLLVSGASAIAREREQGTLRLMFASGADERRIVGGKLLSLSLTILFPVFALTAVALAAAALVPEARMNAEALRAILWLGANGLGLTVVTLIALAISCRSRSVSQAVVMAAFVWLAGTIIVPRVAVGVAGAIIPSPTPSQFAATLAAEHAKVDGSHGGGDAAFEKAVLAKYGVGKIEELPVNFAGLLLDEGERQGNIIFDRQFGALEASYERQRALTRMIGILSPVVSLQNISMALAGTDMASQLALQKQAEAHRRKVVGMLNDDMIANAGRKDFNYLADPRLWGTIPEFRFRAPPLASAVASIWQDVIVLVGWTLFAAWLLWRATRRLGQDILA